MSWAYWAPKSTTRTVSNSSSSSAMLTRHPELAVVDGGLPATTTADSARSCGHHELGLLQLLDRLVAGERHGLAQRAEQVRQPGAGQELRQRRGAGAGLLPQGADGEAGVGDEVVPPPAGAGRIGRAGQDLV